MRAMKRALAVFFVVFVFAACHTKPPPPRAEGCRTDSDCELTTLGEDCCNHCQQIAATRISIAAIRAACNGKTGGPPRCPSLDCPNDPKVAQCVSGACTAVRRPAP